MVVPKTIKVSVLLLEHCYTSFRKSIKHLFKLGDMVLVLILRPLEFE